VLIISALAKARPDILVKMEAIEKTEPWVLQ